MTVLSVVIPCYNEEDGVDQLEGRLMPVLLEISKRYVVELILIDDCSTDATYDRLQAKFGDQPGIRLVRNDANQNVGGAIRTGVQKSTGEWIANLDSDCTYDPALLLPMLELMERGADLVTASPYHSQGLVIGVAPYRLLLSRGASFMYGLLLSTKIRTFTAMVRVYSRDAYKRFASPESDFMALAEMILKAIKQDLRVEEVPAELSVRKFGQSKLRVLRVVIGHLKLMSRLIFAPNSFRR